MILNKLYYGIRNAFIFSRCLDYSADGECEKAFKLSESLNFDYLNSGTHIHMILYVGYAALVTNRISFAQTHLDYFLNNIDSTKKYSSDEVMYLKSYAAKCYLFIDDYESIDLELMNRLKNLANCGASNMDNVAKNLIRTFPQF